MAVTVETALARIRSIVNTPLFVNANNAVDYSAVRGHLVTFHTIKLSEHFPTTAKLPDVDKMLSEIMSSTEDVVVVGLSEYLAFKDESALRQILSKMGKLNKRIIILCSHLDSLLTDLVKDDVRFKDRVIIIDGLKDASPALTLSSFSIKSPNSFKTLNECIASIEEKGCLPAMVISGLNKNVFENGLWPVKTIESAYDALTFVIPNFKENFEKSFGTDVQWLLLYDNLSSGEDICTKNFGVKMPESAIENYLTYPDNLRWLLLYQLMTSVASDYCTLSAKKAKFSNDLIGQLYRSILDTNIRAANFDVLYNQRKKILASLIDESEMQKFSNLADIMGKDKIYYLTDLTELEQKEFIKCITTFEYSGDELISVLGRNYPQLADYLSDYYFGIPFWSSNDSKTGKGVEHDLGEYFERYKWQKLKNAIDEDFVDLVNRIAIEMPRKFIVELPTRSMVMPTTNNLIWVDALGAEFLGYIVKRCDALGLKADIQIARAEMPTLTEYNKEFFDEQRGDKKVNELDALKHSGVGNYDYSKTTLPLYVVNELEIIEQVLKKAKARISSSEQSVTIISDHGASRLVRIYDRTITVDAEVDGKHGGRCCVWEEGINTVSPYASDNENGYCVIANYDRFSGGKYTGVELHGGASLEEVVVPIITLRLKNTDITAIFKKTKITVNRGNAEEIIVTLSAPVKKLRLRISNKFYDSVRSENTTYAFDTDINKPQKCKVALLDDNQVIQDGIELEFVSAVGGTIDLFS